MTLVGKTPPDLEMAKGLEYCFREAIRKGQYDWADEVIDELHKFQSGQIDNYKISRKRYRDVMFFHRIDSSLFKKGLPSRPEAYSKLYEMAKNYPKWKEDQPRIREQKAWDSFTDELQIGVQRILRDKGAASREVFDAINDTVAVLKQKFSIDKKSNFDF